MAVVGSRQNKLPPATSSYVVGRGRGTGGPYTSKRGSNWLMFGTEEEEEKKYRQQQREEGARKEDEGRWKRKAMGRLGVVLTHPTCYE